MHMEFGKQHYRKVDHLQTEVSPIVTPTMSPAYVQARSFVLLWLSSTAAGVGEPHAG